MIYAAAADFAKKKNLLLDVRLPHHVAATVVAIGFMMQTKHLPFSPGVLLVTFTGLAMLISLFLDHGMRCR